MIQAGLRCSTLQRTQLRGNQQNHARNGGSAMFIVNLLPHCAPKPGGMSVAQWLRSLRETPHKKTNKTHHAEADKLRNRRRKGVQNAKSMGTSGISVSGAPNGVLQSLSGDPDGVLRLLPGCPKDFLQLGMRKTSTWTWSPGPKQG